MTLSSPAVPPGAAAPDPERVLDNPVHASLLGPHRHLAEAHGAALRYPLDVARFVGLPEPADAAAWHDLAALAGPGAELAVTGHDPAALPPRWELLAHGQGVQLVDAGLTTAADVEAVALGPDDVPEMLGLVELTRPGPFLPRTIELGTYLGIRRHGELVAMAGERLHPPGWTEISAVCTHPEHRGEGLATRLVRAIGAGIRTRAETPFLHAAAFNTNAIRLYESLGFRLRRRTTFMAVRTPAVVRARSATPQA